MMTVARTRPSKRGYFLLAMVLALMSMCMSMVFSQQSDQLHELDATMQVMRATQARWIAEGLGSYYMGQVLATGSGTAYPPPGVANAPGAPLPPLSRPPLFVVPPSSPAQGPLMQNPGNVFSLSLTAVPGAGGSYTATVTLYENSVTAPPFVVTRTVSRTNMPAALVPFGPPPAAAPSQNYGNFSIQ